MGAIGELLDAESSNTENSAKMQDPNTYKIMYSEGKEGDWGILNFSEPKSKKQVFPDYTTARQGKAKEYEIWKVDTEDKTETVRIESKTHTKNGLAKELDEAYHRRTS
ncbi:MAG: hypothetical protein V5A72_01390 [Candidatus Nanohaloarchaea archaeon]